MEITEEKINNVRAMHYAKTYLDFIDVMLDERSTEFDSTELDTIREKTTALTKKVNTILHRRGMK
jgi:CheY-specific phosphatase CheX